MEGAHVPNEPDTVDRQTPRVCCGDSAERAVEVEVEVEVRAVKLTPTMQWHVSLEVQW
jgi:hypothetical protein